MERAFELKWKAFFIIFERVSVAKCKDFQLPRTFNALARIAPYIGIRKWRTLMNVFFKSQFNYCWLTWMYCNRSLNNKTDRLYEQSLRIVYSDKTSDFSELLEKDGSVSIHYQNIRQLAIEMFKVSKDLCPEIVKESFQFRYNILYNLTQRSQFQTLLYEQFLVVQRAYLSWP